MDNLTVRERSYAMSRVRSKDTKPEVTVRSLLHRMGCRFRLHRVELPGKPDIVLARHRTVVFVHGCFWHRHKGCRHATMPASNVAYWEKKFRGNIERDLQHWRALRRLGWHVIIAWECEARDMDKLTIKLAKALTAAAREARGARTRRK